MADSPYLVALALFDQNGARAMPLSGKSQKREVSADDQPDELCRALVLELLLRVWQRSDDGPLQRASAEHGLLLVELALEQLPDALPRLKAAWIRSGDTPAFMQSLQSISSRAWRISVAKFEPVTLTPLW